MIVTELFLYDKPFDLYENTKLRFTFQINDIAEVKDRQASYTNSISAPKTANNIRILQGLGLTSDTSRTPYSKPECSLRIDGFDLIVKGWFNVKESADEFKIYLYSGLIEFFKAIENKKIGSDLDLSEINHSKNVASVTGSFENSNYRYLITDYNGKTHYGPNDEKINLDYLVPSVSVRYLWAKIHSTFGFNYSGIIFENSAFNNLWITYPKAVAVAANETEILDIGAPKYACAWDTSGSNMFTTAYLLYDTSEYAVNENYEWIKYPLVSKFGNTFNNDGYFKVKKAGWYRFDAALVLKNLSIYTNARVTFCFNAPNTTSNEAYNNYSEYSFDLAFKDGNPYTYTLQGNGLFTKYLQENDTFVIAIKFYDDQYTYQWTFFDDSESTLKVTKIDEQSISFSDELKDFNITDFFKEIVNMFGLTVFPSEHSNNLDYKLLAERVHAAEAEDWSDKYIERTNERYVFDSYAQQNNFSYQYNDKEDSFHDSYIKIDNKNLAEKKDIFKSKMYSPEKELRSFYVGSKGNTFLRVFKLYEKKIKEEEGAVQIEYSALSKRYHYIRANKIDTTVTIGSESIGQEQVVDSIQVGEFTDLSWQRLLTNFYTQFGKILNDSRIHDISLSLNPIDLMLLDEKKLKYFAQEQQYYILNRLSSDGEDGSTGEFVRVKLDDDTSILPEDPTDPEDVSLNILWADDHTNTDRYGVDATQDVEIASMSYPVDDPIVTFEWQISRDSSTWTNLGSSATPYTIALEVGENYIRLKGVSQKGYSFYSNILRYIKAPYQCRQYRAWKYGNSGDDVTIYYYDCITREEKAVTVYAPGGTINFYLEAWACAPDDGTTSSNGNLIDEGPCTP